MSLVSELGPWLTLAKDTATIAALIAGAFWFVFRGKLGRHAQLTLDCKHLQSHREGITMLELFISVENHGEVEQDLEGFEILVAGQAELGCSGTIQTAFVESFPRVLLSQVIREHKANVRPGITRSFSYLLCLPSQSPFIQVEVQLVHDDKSKPILSTRRLFVGSTSKEVL